MITHYTTFNHYDDTIKLVKTRKPDECFICYEVMNYKKPIRLKNNCYYLKKCTCDGSIHKKCLDYWYNIKNTCPICRITIVKNSDIMIKIFKKNRNLFLLIIYIKNNIRRIKNIFCYFLLLYISYNILEFITTDFMKVLYYETNIETNIEI